MRIASVMITAFIFLVSANVASARQLVVVDSTVPELAPGKVLTAGTPVILPPGAKVTLVGDDGRMQKVEGPFSGTLGGGPAQAGGDPAVVDTLSKLFTSPTETAALGTFRSAEPQMSGFRGTGSTGDPSAPDLWAINVQRGGDQCIQPRTQPMLWRPDAVREATVAVQRLPDGPGGLVRFSAGAQSVAWPGGVPVQDGNYVLRDSADAWKTTLSLRVVPDGLSGEINRAVWMADHGCESQAKALITSAQ